MLEGVEGLREGLDGVGLVGEEDAGCADAGGVGETVGTHESHVSYQGN